MFERLKSLLIRPPTNRRNRGARGAQCVTGIGAAGGIASLDRLVAVVRGVDSCRCSAFRLPGGRPGLVHQRAGGECSQLAGSPGAWASDIAYFVLGATVWWLLAFAVLAIWRASRVCHCCARRPMKLMRPATGRRHCPSLAHRRPDAAGCLQQRWKRLRCTAGLPGYRRGRRALGQSLGFPCSSGRLCAGDAAVDRADFHRCNARVRRSPGLTSASGSVVCCWTVSLAGGRNAKSREIRRDFEIAAPEVELRDLYVQEETRRVEEHEPIRIVETFEPVVLSERVERESNNPVRRNA